MKVYVIWWYTESGDQGFLPPFLGTEEPSALSVDELMRDRFPAEFDNYVDYVPTIHWYINEFELQHSIYDLF